jgi:hypothetical protein
VLRGADLLARMARTQEADFSQWSGKRRAEVELIIGALRRVGEQSGNGPDRPSMRLKTAMAHAG